MARQSTTTNVTNLQLHALNHADFDANGVRKAVIAFLLAMHKSGRMSTIAEVLIALETLDSHIEGDPHSMKSLSEELDIPYTSVSRIVFSLTSDAAPGGLLKLVPDTRDRRRKHIEIDLEAFEEQNPEFAALEQAMIEYYGTSVAKLKKTRRT